MVVENFPKLCLVDISIGVSVGSYVPDFAGVVAHFPFRRFLRLVF